MENITIEAVHPLLYPDVVTLRIKGFIYADTLVQMDQAIQSVLSSPQKKLIFDLAETNYISSGGWAFLITAFQRFRDQGGDLVLAGMKSEVHDAFELLEYHKVIRLFANSEDALKQAFSPASNPVS
jgi:anti-anti-sigma factor